MHVYNMIGTEPASALHPRGNDPGTHTPGWRTRTVHGLYAYNEANGFAGRVVSCTIVIRIHESNVHVYVRTCMCVCVCSYVPMEMSTKRPKPRDISTECKRSRTVCVSRAYCYHYVYHCYFITGIFYLRLQSKWNFVYSVLRLPARTVYNWGRLFRVSLLRVAETNVWHRSCRTPCSDVRIYRLLRVGLDRLNTAIRISGVLGPNWNSPSEMSRMCINVRCLVRNRSPAVSLSGQGTTTISKDEKPTLLPLLTSWVNR